MIKFHNCFFFCGWPRIGNGDHFKKILMVSSFARTLYISQMHNVRFGYQQSAILTMMRTWTINKTQKFGNVYFIHLFISIKSC